MERLESCSERRSDDEAPGGSRLVREALGGGVRGRPIEGGGGRPRCRLQKSFCAIYSVTTLDRLLALAVPEANTGCLLWPRYTDPEGYGRAWHEGKNWRVHRLAWTLAFGPIPPGDGYHGMCVRHICDQPACILPDHLQLGTHRQNMDDAVRRKRHPSGDRHWTRRPGVVRSVATRPTVRVSTTRDGALLRITPLGPLPRTVSTPTSEASMVRIYPVAWMRRRDPAG